MSKPGLVIFDCDGVLVDSEALSTSTTCRYLGTLGIPMSDEHGSKLFRGLANESIRDLVEMQFNVILPDDFVLCLEAYEREAMATGDLRLIPGARHAVQRVVGAARPLCVASNAEVAKMEITLGRLGLLEYFQGRLFSKDHVARGKPAPDLFLHAAAQMGMPPTECVVVEDSAAGVQGAVEAGMRVLGYAPRGDVLGLSDLGAEVFPSMADVPSLLGI